MDQDVNIDKISIAGKSSSTLQSQQDIGKPDIRIQKCERKYLQVVWSTAEGATKHTLLLRNLNQVVKEFELVKGHRRIILIDNLHGIEQCEIKATGGVKKNESTTERLEVTWRYKDFVVLDVKNEELIDWCAAKRSKTEIKRYTGEQNKREELVKGRILTNQHLTDKPASDCKIEASFESSGVPRNVLASQSPVSPTRSILVTFDDPILGQALEYKIAAVPEFGMTKILECKSNTFLVEYLRKGCKYEFFVFAKHRECAKLEYMDRERDWREWIQCLRGKWSDGIVSNSIKTEGEYTQIGKVNKGHDFGKVRNLTIVPQKENMSITKELLVICWEVPLFDNNMSDYKVKEYEVEIRKTNSTLRYAFNRSKFEKGLQKYSTSILIMKLGRTYDISVTTIYIDIEQDEKCSSRAVTEKVQTRPCEPTGVKCDVKTNDLGEDYLRIIWNFARGAKYYKVEIHTDKSEEMEPLFKSIVDEHHTEWQQIFDDKFGYGTSYHAVITAIGDGNKSNFKRTPQQTNFTRYDYSLTKVQAAITHNKIADPTTQVYLSWEPATPAQQLESYEVTVIENETKQIINCQEPALLITGLKAGTYYTFMVVTIYKEFRRRSVGCVSNRIQTNLSKTSSCQSKSVRKHDCTLSNDELKEIHNLIVNSEVGTLEFCNCKIGNDYCTPNENQGNTAKCKILKLTISYTDYFNFSQFFYSIFVQCEIKSLCIVYANLDDLDVENLHIFMKMNQIRGIENLDLSYNKKIGPKGFERIGNIISEQGIKTLKLIDCNLGEIKLAELLDGLKNYFNLRELDISCNDNLAEKGFEVLGKLVASKRIAILKLSGCLLTENTIQVFHNKLESVEKFSLKELDVSYNHQLSPVALEILGLTIKKFGITTLNLAGCGICKEHLQSLKKDTGNTKIYGLNLRDNAYPGNIIVEIADIVSEFKLQELDISDCMFSVSELKEFRNILKTTKLRNLCIGDQGRELSMEYIQEVCQLLENVEEMLYLRFYKLDKSSRRLLKEQSDKLSVAIHLCDESQALEG